MRNYARHLYRFIFAGSMMLALSCVPSGAWAQQTSNAQNSAEEQTRAGAQEFSRADLATFDEFLDANPEIARTLRANPMLISDSSYLDQHAGLKTFLNAHTQLQQEISENPAAFMTGIQRFEATEGNRSENGMNRNPNPDLTRREVANMDQFLDSHRDIEEQLEANPSLINNQDFLQNHPQLQSYLNQHPQVAEEFAENPKYFIVRLNRYERSPADQAADNRGRNPNPDLTRSDLASMDQFLDAHQAVEEQLQANPSLINDQDFLRDHPQLQNYLNQHPQVAEEFTENPQYFILRERGYERTPADQAADNPDNDRNPNAGRYKSPNPDLTRPEILDTEQFLDGHQDLERQLQANPSLINNQDFLSDHPELQDFLNDHPNIREEFTENPQNFMREEAAYENYPNPPGTERKANPDLTRGEVANMDQFLDAHQDIQRQLQANPSLINNVSYLSKHPQLRDFLNDHPQVREEFTENPSLFMQREGQFERTEGRYTETRYTDRDLSQQDVAQMDEYLDKHAGEARELEAYPARVNDSDYLSHHKDLGAFFKKHPQVREEFTENPSAFMGAESQFEANSEMDEFLDAHKNVKKDLDDNPGRVKDNDYLNHHKGLKNFLDKNPGVNDRLENNPNAFMDNEKRFDADREMDVYLTKHRDVAKDLQKSPDHLKDDKYLDHHKDLKELMEKHPDMQQRVKMNPSAYMQEQMKFHEDYRNAQMHEKTRAEQRANVHGAH